MNDIPPRPAPPLADAAALLRGGVPRGPRGTLWARVLAALDREAVAAAWIVRADDEEPHLLAATATPDAATRADLAARHRALAAATLPSPVGARRATVALRERGRPVAALTVETRAPLDAAGAEALELFAALASALLTDRSRALETELVAGVAALFDAASDVRSAATEVLGTLLPRLEAAAGLVIEAGATDTSVLTAVGFAPEDEAAFLAARVPYPDGLAWRACLAGEARFTRDYRADPARLPDAAARIAPVVLVQPLVRLGVARRALVLAFAEGHEPTEGDRALVAGVGRVLASLLAAHRERERNERMLEFQYRALTEHVDGLLDALLGAAIDVVPGAECGSLLVRDGHDGTYHYRALRGFDAREIEPVRFAEEDLLAWYDPSGATTTPTRPRILTAPDDGLTRHATATGATRAWAAATRTDEIRANLCVPILEEGRPIAFLNLDNRVRGDAFGADSVRTVEWYARSVAALLLGAIRRDRVLTEAITDPLTGLLNRRGLELRGEAVRAAAERAGTPFTLLVMDLHGFKGVNDRMGHDAGDRALRTIARALAREARKGDVLARWGGDEFVALLPGTGAEEGARVAARLRAAVGALDLAGGEVGIDIGPATYPGDGRDPDVLIQVADARMYAAKRQRRGEDAAWPYQEG